MSRRLLLGLALALQAGLHAAPAEAFDIERNFAGSAQLDYLAVPTDAGARGLTFDGFTTELSLKLAVDFGENVSASVKVCYGCHGFETDMAQVDVRVADELAVRIGRMNPSFGDFPLRHDPANHRASSKPLPYDMGRMLRLREWNMSILPSPYVDNGLEVYGTHWFGDDVQLDYAAWIVSGLKGSDGGTDLDFVLSRSGALYYVDNNSEPAVGGRVAWTFNLGDDFAATLGASGAAGHYDPSRQLGYVILGADLYLRISELVVRAEYLARRTDMGPGAERFTTVVEGAPFFVKDGFYVEGELPLGERWELLARFDGLRRRGPVPRSAALRTESAVLRTTLGGTFAVIQAARIKASVELWDFSDFADEVAFHVGVVANF